MRSKDLFGVILRPARALAAFAPVALAVVFLASPALAQGDDALAGINRQIGERAAKGETDKVAPLAERYVALARKTYGEEHPEYATAITWLGWVYQEQERYGKAEPLLKRALLIRETVFGSDHALVATSLNNLAGLYQVQGRYADADPLLERANAIRLKAVGLDDLEALPRQIQELQWSGQEKEAAALADRYVELATERFGEQPGLVPALMEAASLFEQQGDAAKAEALLKQAARIREAAFGPDSLEVAEILEALGRVYQTAGRYKDAEGVLKHALDIRVAALGEGSEPVIDTMQALAGVYEAQGRQAEAEKFYAQAQKLQERTVRRHAYRRPEPSYAVVRVFYATDRKNTGATDPAAVYGGDRGPLAFGTATVSIPRDHRMGALETPSIWRLEWSNDPERFVVLLSVDEVGEAKFFEEVAARVKKSGSKSAFVFVHGYNVTFADAARRTAQMTYDLGFDGAPVFYSWPSQARYAAYKVDETNAEWARVDFKNFLKTFVEQSDAERIYLVAHSMGTRVLTGALKELVLEDPAIRDKFADIILAAPDIDADTFKRDIAPRILAGERGTTLYASSGDYALMASKTFAGYPRAGDTADGVIIAPGVDTIDASSIRTDFVGHSYYADSDSVLADLRDLFLGKPPDKRAHLAPAESEGGRYWVFSPK